MLAVNNAQHAAERWRLSKSDAHLKAASNRKKKISAGDRDGQQEEAEEGKETRVTLLHVSLRLLEGRQKISFFLFYITD